MVAVIQGFGFTFHWEQCTATCVVTPNTILSDWFNNDSVEWEPPTLLPAPPPGVSLKGTSIQVWSRVTCNYTRKNENVKGAAKAASGHETIAGCD